MLNKEECEIGLTGKLVEQNKGLLSPFSINCISNAVCNGAKINLDEQTITFSIDALEKFSTEERILFMESFIRSQRPYGFRTIDYIGESVNYGNMTETAVDHLLISPLSKEEFISILKLNIKNVSGLISQEVKDVVSN
jgi:hypothetical protein